jgi:hypothetical protein
LTRRTTSIGLALAALLAGGCDTGTDPSDVSMVELVESFGFCPPTSYCTTRLRVVGRQAVVTLESRANGVVETNRLLRDDEADAIARSAANTHFEGVGPVIGCPDCADGGAESLSVTAASQTSKVTFEYRASVAELEPLRAVLATTRPVP